MSSTKRIMIGLGAVVVLSLVALALVRALAPAPAAVEIWVDGTLVETVALEGPDLPRTILLSGAWGSNTVEIQPGRARVSHADCPDQVCVRQGWIADGTVPIVCLPHRVTVKVVGEGVGGLDAATGR